MVADDAIARTRWAGIKRGSRIAKQADDAGFVRPRPRASGFAGFTVRCLDVHEYSCYFSASAFRTISPRKNTTKAAARVVRGRPAPSAGQIRAAASGHKDPLEGLKVAVQPLLELLTQLMTEA
jgi:hypothetical protein